MDAAKPKHDENETQGEADPDTSDDDDEEEEQDGLVCVDGRVISRAAQVLIKRGTNPYATPASAGAGGSASASASRAKGSNNNTTGGGGGAETAAAARQAPKNRPLLKSRGMIRLYQELMAVLNAAPRNTFEDWLAPERAAWKTRVKAARSVEQFDMALNDLGAHIQPSALASWYHQCKWYTEQRASLAKAKIEPAPEEEAEERPGWNNFHSARSNPLATKHAEQRRVALAALREEQRLEQSVKHPANASKLLLRLYGLDQALQYK